ncbi:MAG: hypothetical protein JSV67_01965 [Thermoplasmatales archaeon]|nr:MAG: hypothetical protein JSV67_01965 [Thermoplasmatales archaeon]
MEKKFINLLALIIVILNIVLIAGCITHSNNKEKKIITDIFIGMTRNISGFYPWMASRDVTTITINTNLFTGLTDIDPFTDKIVPALAESWNNPNNVTWRFYLRKGVQFHNGNLFTAEDVKFTIEYMRNYSFFDEELESISDVIIVDNYTIDIITKYPVPTLLYKLGNLFILSENYIRTIEDTNETWPIGTGAYKLLEYLPGDHISLERFDDYWKGQPEVQKVTFKKMNDIVELKNALINRELDIIPLGSEDIEEIQNTSGLKAISVQTVGVIYLSFDFRVNDSFGFKGSKNPVSDIRVRKAIYHSVNIDTIIEKFFNDSVTPASQFITEYTIGYNPNISRLPYDIELAKELIREAGYEAGFTIELDTLNSGKLVNISTEITDQLSEINITVILNAPPADEYYTKLYYKNTSFYIAGIYPIEVEGFIKLLLQTSDLQKGNGIWNYGNYSNSELDRLYEILSNSMDFQERIKYIHEIFSLAASDVAWIPLFSPKNFYGMIDEINWNPSPRSIILVETISFKN